MGRLWKSGARKNRNPKPLKRAPTAHGRRAAGPSNYRRMKRVGMLRPTARAAVEARLAESGKRQVVATHQASYDHMVRDLKALQAEERELAIQGTLSMGTNRYNQ
ncbi:MAG TPA: hypothetical protein HA252_01330, partial [Candidatus Diapherotrites archaeon]|nr:hypothetical protein [Candidatus Diapherotrites archaeon]